MQLPAIMPAWSNFALIILAYLVGGFSPGYWLVRRRIGVDIRTVGSGGTGATNVGRVLGRGAYAAVLVTDVVKGAMVAAAARLMGVSNVWAFAAALAVLAGHVWPIWLGFRGGKGVGPFVGSWLVLAPLALVPCLALILLLLPWLRKFSVAGLCGLALLPVSAWWATHSRAALVAACATFSLLLWSHRVNLRAFVVARIGSGAPSTAATPTEWP
jgi:glycerol-3-phosphate acyltransferase PlsY